MQKPSSPVSSGLPVRRWTGTALAPLAWARGVALRRRYGRLSRAHAAARFPAIQAALDAAEPGFLFVVGDSHAELLCHHAIGERAVVSGGVGGISAGTYAANLPCLRFGNRPGTAILLIGSNDIVARARPLSEPARDRFEAAAVAILCWLRVHADRVLVTALPPIGPVPPLKREPEAVDDYSARLDRLSRQSGCAFADPFAALRAGGGWAQPGALADGVHLADYGSVAAAMAALLS